MADLLLVASSYSDSETSFTSLGVDGASAIGKDDLVAGDRVGIRSAESGMSVTGFTSTLFDTTSALALTTSYTYRTIKAGVGGGVSNSLEAKKGSITDTPALSISTAVPSDSTPNAFNFANVTDQNPNSSFTISRGITGFNVGLAVNITTNPANTPIAMLIKAGNAVKNRTTIYSGETLILSGDAPSAYNNSYTITVTIGNTSQTITVATKAGPDVGQLIQLPIFSPSEILLNRDVAGFFGGAVGDRWLSHYVRGGAYVPDIPQNSTIPTTIPLDITQLYGAYTTYYFEEPPVGKMDDVDTSNSPQTLWLQWDKRIITNKAQQDWQIGYGERLELESMYKFVVNHTHTENPNDVNIILNTGVTNAGVFALDNNYIRLEVTVPQYEERFYEGTLEIHAQNQHDPSYSIVETVPWSIIFFGP